MHTRRRRRPVWQSGWSYGPHPVSWAGVLAASSLLVGGAGLVLGDASDGLREVSLGLAQGLRASDLGAGLLDGLMGLFESCLKGWSRGCLFSFDMPLSYVSNRAKPWR